MRGIRNRLAVQARQCKAVADRLFGPGGVNIQYATIQKLKDMYTRSPDVDMSGDIARALRHIGL